MKILVNNKTVQADLKDSLTRAVIISLFSWARSNDAESVKNGWWGDSLSQNNDDDTTGSLLWTLLRQKLTDDVLLQAKEYAEQSLKWLIDDNVCSSIEIDVSRDFDTLNMTILLIHDNQETSIIFEDLINGIH